MNRSRILLVAAVMLAGCTRHEHGATPAARGAAVVRTARASEVRWPVGEEVTGTVRAARTASVAATMLGTVADVRVALGDRVRAGDILVRISAGEIAARLAQAEAVHAQAKLDHDRSVALRDHAAISQAEADASGAQFRVAEAARSEARAMADHTMIRAPFTGIVSAKLVEVGDVAVPGRPLVVIEAPELLRLEAMVPEAVAHALPRGEKPIVSIDATGETVEGTVVEISPSAEEATRSVLVKLDLPRGTVARPGMFGRVRTTTSYRGAVAVPEAALVRRGQLEEIFVVEDRTARLRLVRAGRARAGIVELLAGVREGETVAISGSGHLVDGQSIEPQP